MTKFLTLQLTAARHAQTALRAQSDSLIATVLTDLATALEAATENILLANAADLAGLDTNDPTYDRIQLTEVRIRGIAEGVRTVASLPDPVGRLLEERPRPNGLVLQKVSVPFGTVAAIYEARPNVTIDSAALCLKSRNVAVLKGGREADQTSRALVGILHDVLRAHQLPPAVVTLLPVDRAVAAEVVAAHGWIDLLVVRGSQSLIEWAREHARVPFIETGAGVCHTYVDGAADLPMAARIIANAKTRRVSICNALDTLIVHASLLPKIDQLTDGLIRGRVELRADERSFDQLTSNELVKRAKPEDFGTEFLDRILAIKTVDSLAEALAHIARYGSHHSEAIVTNATDVAETFLSSVDAACVYHNASIAFTDGGEFGMGAELGISTQKLHARGPMALPELCTYQWRIRGSGQTRPDR